MTAETDIYDVAIIGGGFSGLMALHHLVKDLCGGRRFAIIEPEENLGHGLAYRTANPRHLLNVPAGKMSALPDEPDHFIKWLLSEAGCNASRELGLSPTWQPGDYVPRCLYARYLDGIARETFSAAEAKETRAHHLRRKVVDIDRASSGGLYALKLDDGRVLQSRAVILATGNLSAAVREKIPGVIADPWRYDHAAMPLAEGAVGIIGAGLTMIDTLLSLRSAGFAGEILVASRRGLLPGIHDDTPAAYEAALSLPAEAPAKPAQLMQALRGEAKNCLSRQIPWQRALDRWRPHAAAIWGKLGTHDRIRFFNRLFTLWNVHRHRMAPAIGAVIGRELAAGTLKILHGRIKIVPQAEGLSLVVDGKPYTVQKIFDCRGVCHDISLADSGLIATLHGKGLLLRHETGWGIQTNPDQQVLPVGQDGSFLAIGPLLIGAYLETTAVPELRQQAQKAAVDLNRFIQSEDVTAAKAARSPSR